MFITVMQDVFLIEESYLWILSPSHTVVDTFAYVQDIVPRGLARGGRFEVFAAGVADAEEGGG